MEPMIEFSGHLRPQLPIIRSSTRLLSFTELQQESVYLRRCLRNLLQFGMINKPLKLNYLGITCRLFLIWMTLVCAGGELYTHTQLKYQFFFIVLRFELCFHPVLLTPPQRADSLL
ncbi:uncharacterized protein LOC110942720 isoform X2 [Helianthus annuus]|uniref:uncharacterized protein LOC110942720 isoform X2 n=1 Tax=Helianthus annuus TaxID=4232 RepID=UPI001652F20A|nr:uncharacterized protein LOC110942720 isoform X2 [Helianthus annuus]